MRVVRKRYTFDAFVEVDIDDSLNLIDNGKCVSILRGDKVIGYMCSTPSLLEVIKWPYAFHIIAYRGTLHGFDMTRPIAVLRYKERGG